MYLGAMLSSDGGVDAEVARRLGGAHADFKALRRVWSHSSLSQNDKVSMFFSCVVSRLVYGLSTAWLSTATRRKLDGFQARCMRRIFKIPPAFLSRVSNACVLRQAGCLKLSTSIRQQQLILAGRCMASPDNSVIRAALERWLTGAPWAGGRQAGRPRATWFEDVFTEAVALAGSTDRLALLGGRPSAWRHEVLSHCRRKCES